MRKRAGIKHSPKPAAITLKELNRVVQLSQLEPVSLSDLDDKSAMAQLKLKQLSEKIGMRRQWSTLLMFCVAVIIIGQLGIFSLMGLGIFKYDDEWVARLMFPGVFGEVLGLIYIVINYLFPNNKKVIK